MFIKQTVYKAYRTAYQRLEKQKGKKHLELPYFCFEWAKDLYGYDYPRKKNRNEQSTR